MYSNVITFRVDKKTKVILKNLTKEMPDGITRLLRKLILFYINKEKDSEKIELELKQEIKDYLSEIEFKKQKERHKRKLFYYHLIGNTLKSIYQLSRSYLLNSGEINMEIINKVIDSMEEVYNTYPEDIKNDLKGELDNIKSLKDEQVLIGKIKTIKLLSFKKQEEK